MTEEEKGVIEHASIIVKEGLDKEDDIQGILKKLLNLIQKQQAEIEKKDKIIGLILEEKNEKRYLYSRLQTLYQMKRELAQEILEILKGERE